jgi:hypothetical protein
MNDFDRLREHVDAALKLSGTRKRFTGIVAKVDGSTTFVKSGDREFLAWSRPELIVAAPVEFTMDQFRAKDVESPRRLFCQFITPNFWGVPPK